MSCVRQPKKKHPLRERRFLNNSLAGSFSRSLEQRSHIHVETTVGITGSYNLSTTVVSVLTHLSDHDTRLATFFLGKLGQSAQAFWKSASFLVSDEYTPDIVLMIAL